MISKKVFVKTVLLFVLMCVVVPGVFAATFTWDGSEYLNGIVEINESPAFVFDNNVSVDDSLVNFSTNAVDVGFDYLDVDEDGVLTVTLPYGYLGSELFILTNTITLIAANISDEFDQITSPFRLNITNVNDPPNITNITPSSSIVINETESQFFESDVFDIDPTLDTVNATWFFNANFIQEEIDTSPTNITFVSNLSSAGNHTITLTVRDNFNAVTNFSWDLDVVNVNQAPNITNSSPSTATVIEINETDSVNFTLNYTDPDGSYPSVFELYLMNATWFVDGVLNYTEVEVNNSNFTLTTTLDTVQPPATFVEFSIVAIVNDTNLTDTATWTVNVSFANQAPTINQSFLDGVVVDYDDLYNSTEGTANNISFSASDPDDNIAIQRIYVDGVLNASSNETEIFWEFFSGAEYNITVYVEDALGLSDNQSFILNVSQNTAPIIENLTIYNSTGGLFYSEGDLLNITFNFTDAEGNTNETRIAINGTTIATSTTTSFALNFSSRGTYNISVFVGDVGSLSDTAFNDTINVSPVEFTPVIYDILMSNSSIIANLSQGDVFSGTEAENFFAVFNRSDTNGNDTIDVEFVNVTSLDFGYTFQNLNQFVTINTNYSSAGLYNITYFVNDTTGRSNTTFFYLNISNNTIPNLENIMVLNGTGGNETFYEGDLINISFACSDNESNDDRKLLIFNNSVEVNTTLSGQQHNFTYVLSFASRGVYDLNISCSDDEPLVAQFNRNITVLAVEVAPVFEVVNASNITGIVDIAGNGSNVTIYETDSFQTASFASDINGNQTIDGMWIFINDILVNSSNSSNVSYGFLSNFSSQGIYNVSHVVQDTSGANTTRLFFLNITNNEAPEFLMYNATNSSGGNVTFYENGTITLFALANNSLGDIVNTTIVLNGTTVCSANESNCSYTWMPGFESRGNYSVEYYIQDTQGLNITRNISVILLPFEIAPSITTIIANATRSGGFAPSDGDNITVNEGENISLAFYASDINGNQSIENYTITFEGSLNASANNSLFIFNYTNEGIYEVVLFVNDSSGLNQTANMTVIVNNNTAPQIENITYFNTTGGNISFRENQAINITFDAFDTQSNGVSVEIYVNQTQIVSDTQAAFTQQNVIENIPFVGVGNQTLTIIVFDEEGLNVTFNATINVTSGDRNPTLWYVQVNSSTGIQNLSEGQSVNVTEGEEVQITAFLTDPNGNDTLDVGSLLINSTLFNQSQNSSLLFANLTFAYGYLAFHNVTIDINDTVGLNSSNNVTIRVINNVVPEILNVSILNVTNGTFIAENTTAQVTVTATDNNSNIESYNVTFNNATSYNTSSFTYFISPDARGLLNFTVYVFDREGLFANTSGNATVNATEITPIVNDPRLEEVIPSSGDLVINYTIETALEFSFFPYDPNGNATVANATINISTTLTEVIYNTTNVTLTFDDNDAGILHNVTYYVIDETGLNASLSFVFLPQNIEEVEVEVPSSGGSGGGGSGGGGGGSSPFIPPNQPDVQIQGSPPLVFDGEEEIIQEILIENKGGRALTDLNITAQVNSENVTVEVLSFPLNISQNSSIPVRVRIRAPNVTEPFEVTLSASGKGSLNQEFSDEATIFVNAQVKIREDNSDFNATAQVVSSFLRDNAKCLELMNMVDEAQAFASQGDFETARVVLDQAREDCLRRAQEIQQPLNAIIPEQSQNLNVALIIILSLVLIILLLPSIYFLVRKIKPEQKVVDKKEQEIEKFLEEFYE